MANHARWRVPVVRDTSQLKNTSCSFFCRGTDDASDFFLNWQLAFFFFFPGIRVPLSSNRRSSIQGKLPHYAFLQVFLLPLSNVCFQSQDALLLLSQMLHERGRVVLRWNGTAALRATLTLPWAKKGGKKQTDDLSPVNLLIWTHNVCYDSEQWETTRLKVVLIKVETHLHTHTRPVKSALKPF